MAPMIVYVVISTVLTGLVEYGDSHMIIPVHKWPLTDQTSDMDVMTGEHSAYLSKQKYQDGYPVFGYKAYKLEGKSYVKVNFTAPKEFTIIVYLFFKYNDDQLLLSFQDSNGKTNFQVHVDDKCYLVMSTSYQKGALRCRIEKCAKLKKEQSWHVVSVSVKDDKLSVTLFQSLESELAPIECVSCSGLEIADRCGLTGPASLYLGFSPPNNETKDTPTSMEGKAFCLQIYDEEVNSFHVEEQLREVCSKIYPHLCMAKPCQNGGQCEGQDDQYSCRCTPWFTGRVCASELWIANRGFHLVAYGEPDDANALYQYSLVPVGSRRKCSALCLKENSCWSFSLARPQNSGDYLCTLYDGIGSHFQHSLDAKYYIPV